MIYLRSQRLSSKFELAQGPIVVGGVGGSGTRVVAEMMRLLGIYTGSDLNKAGDNKWFTLLCKLPRWDLDETSPDAIWIDRSLDILERAMTGELAPSRADRRFIAAVVGRCAEWDKSDPLPDDRPLPWLRGREKTLRRSRRHTPHGAPLWGWKEPNSHLLLPHLRRHFGDRLRYVHMIRNGAYMAHSTNQSQMRRWGPRFGIVTSDLSTAPIASLDYWIAANELAIARGRVMPSGSFLLVSYDELCASPREGVAKLIDLLGLDPPRNVMEQLVSLPHPARPPNLTPQDVREEFGEERLERVRELGFCTD